MSGGMRNVAATTQSAMGAAVQSINRIRSASAGAARGLDTIPAAARRTGSRTMAPIATLERALRRLEYRRSISLNLSDLSRTNQQIRAVERELDRLRNHGVPRPGGGGGSSSGRGGLLGLLGISPRTLVAGLGLTAIGAGVGTVANMGMDAGAKKMSYEVMAGQKDGGKLYDDLTKFANDSIFGREVYKNSQTMLAFGASAREIMPDLKMLGDISMGNKQRFESLSLAFSQSRAAGRLMGQDLLQFVNAGFNPLQVISEKTGKSIGDLRKMMEKGQISFAMVKQAFIDATSEGGKFYNMTNKIAETPFGKWEALKGQISGVGVEFGLAMMPMVSMFVDTVKPIIAALPGLIGKIMPPILEFSKQFMPVITELGGVLMEVLPSAFKLVTSVAGGLLKVLKPFLPLIETILGAFGRLADSLADKLGTIFEYLGRFFDWLIPKTNEGAENMMDGITGTIMDNKGNVANAMGQVLYNGEIETMFQEAGRKHGQLYADELQDMIKGIDLRKDQKDILATWATVNGKPVAAPGSKDAYGDYLSQTKNGQQVLDQAAVLLREIGLKQGRDAFEKKVNEYRNAKAMLDFTEAQAAIVRKGIDKVAQEQRNYLTKLANGEGTPKSKKSGYESIAGDNGEKMNARGVTHSGPRVITININKEMIGSLSINSYNIKEGVGELEHLVEDALDRILHNATTEE